MSGKKKNEEGKKGEEERYSTLSTCPAVPPGCLAGPAPPSNPNIIAVPGEGRVELGAALEKPRGIALAVDAGHAACWLEATRTDWGISKST